MNLNELKDKIAIELNNKPIDESKILTLINRFKYSKKQMKSNPETILILACETFGVSTKMVLTKNRHRQYAYARKIYSKHMHSLGIYSFREIGKQLKRDHSSIICAYRSAEDLIEFDAYFQEKWKLFNDKVDAVVSDF